MQSPNLLLGVPGDERQVDGNRQPVAIDEEEESQEPVDSGFRDDVRVQAVAEIDRVDVVAVVANSSARRGRGRRYRGPVRAHMSRASLPPMERGEGRHH